MSAVTDLHAMTKEIYDYVCQPLPKDDRESYIEQLQQLLNKQEHLIASLQNSEIQIAETEQGLVDEIVHLGPKIQEKLKLYKNLVSFDINYSKRQKEVGVKYSNPFQHDPIDGAFIDKKR